MSASNLVVMGDVVGLYVANKDCLEFSDALGSVLRWVGKADKPPVTEIITDMEVLFKLDRLLASVELATAEIIQAREAEAVLGPLRREGESPFSVDGPGDEGWGSTETYTFRPKRLLVDKNHLEKIRAIYEGSRDAMIIPLGERITMCPRCASVHFWVIGENEYVCECGLVVKMGTLDSDIDGIQRRK